ncbi:glycosyltransferase family 2 protein [Candidatus Deianiraea vastatrix]|uniref:O-antigen RfbV-like glycosyltransferase n=1 Tax=Candidatus Deianiraea vastatrix TaxID=2163644 RepID=A0A5B8XF41_9RICK|nr:glycosyltransferase family 2 protein [Candidatus Deianiraea vastatrix]QED23880.1 Putative O-antigen RfbV-like glycosyltransferase [Candidatus Deianiraea vastatrix]
MNKKISLSIGIPMYNHERTIRATLNSIVSQLNEIKEICDLDVIIVDNCSTDKSPEIIKDEYVSKYPDVIKYFRNEENIGLSRNLSRPFELSEKDYVWLCGDDALVENAILTVCKEGLIHNPDMVCTGCATYSDTSFLNVVHPYIPRFNKQSIKCDNFIDFLKHSGWCFNLSIFKTQEVKKLSDIDIELVHPQMDIGIQICKNSKCMIFIDKFLFKYFNGSRSVEINFDYEYYLAYCAYYLFKKRGINPLDIYSGMFDAVKTNICNQFSYRLKDKKRALELFFNCTLFDQKIRTIAIKLNKISTSISFIFVFFAIKNTKQILKALSQTFLNMFPQKISSYIIYIIRKKYILNLCKKLLKST